MSQRASNAFWASLAIVLFALVMGGLHLMLTGINRDFGVGAGLGLMLGLGLAFLASKNLRNS